MISENLSRSTIRGYKSDVNHFLYWLNGRGENLLKIDRNLAGDYLHHLLGSSHKLRSGKLGRYSQSTIRRKVAALISFYRMLRARGDIELNPFLGLAQLIPNIPQSGLRSVHFKPEIIRRLLEVCDTGTPKGIRDRAIITLIAVLGLRVVDVHRLDIDDVDISNAFIRTSDRKNQGRNILVTVEVSQVLRTWIATRGLIKPQDHALFVSLHWSTGRGASGRRLSTRAVRAVVDRNLRLCGSKEPGASCLALRQSAVVNVLGAGADIHGIRSMYGISAQTIRAYQQLSAEVLGIISS